MVNHLWGKYERVANYKDVYEERLIRSASYDKDAWGKQNGLFTVDGKLSLNQFKYYTDYEIENGRYIGTRIASNNLYLGGHLIFSSVPEDIMDILSYVGERSGKYIIKNAQEHYNADREVYIVTGSLYEIVSTRVLSGYSKGSYLGDVKSTNRNDFPDNGEKNGYYYVYKGIDNQAPTISGRDEDLGDKNTPFKQSFTVNDGDSGNILKVTVKLNSATIRTIENANRNETYYVDIDKIKFEELEPNRQNTITVTVDDGNGASANRRWTFTKKNTPPTVRVEQSNKGEQNSPFSFTFTPDDADGDVITGKIFLDDVQIEDLGTLTKKQEKTVKLKKLDFAKLTNGEHKIRIEITDIKGGKGYGYVEFTKKLTNCWYEFKKEIEGQATEIIVNPSVQIADGAKLTIKVCNNANDSSPAWEVVPSEQVGKSYTFKNRSKVSSRWAIGVNLRIDRGSAKEDSYLYGFVGNYQ